MTNNDGSNDDNSNNNTPAAAAVVIKQPVVEQTEPDELSRLRAEVEKLKAERAAEKVAQDEALADQRLKTLAAAARKPAESLDSGHASVARSKAITAVGGNAYWFGQSPEARCAALGVPGSETVKDSDIKKVFGPTSDAMAAQQLAKHNPAQYKAWKIIAIERHIL